MNKFIKFNCLLFLVISIIACTQKEENMNNFLDDNILGNVTIDGSILTGEGELPYKYPGYKIELGNKIFTIDTTQYSGVIKVKKILENSDFKPLSYEAFREKILTLYKIDVDTIEYTYDLTPPIDNEHVNDGIAKYGFILLYGGSGIWGDYASDENIIMYNKMILNDDTLAFNWMKINQPERIISQVRDLKVTSNSKWLKFAFENTNFWRYEDTFHDYVFKGSRDDHRYYLDKNMLDTMIVNGVDMTYLSNILETLEYAKKTNDKSYAGNYDDMIEFMYHKISQVGQMGYIEGRINSDASYMQYLKDHNYWNDQDLRHFCTKVYLTSEHLRKEGEGRRSGLDPYPNYYINDKDGYTNLRSKPSAQSDIVTTIPDKEFISVLERKSDDGWWKVLYKDFQGYVHSSRIRVEH